jgi:hypothetical protein
MAILLLNKEKNEWESITLEQKKALPKEIQDECLTISDALRQRLDKKMEERDRNNDIMGIIDGKEGTGKSSLAGEIMRYVTKDTFDPKKDMIGSDYEDALNKLDNVKHKGFLMFDEGNAFFMSTDTTKKESRELHKIFSIFRQLNLFVIICLPSFMRMNSYFAQDRPKFLCSTYMKKGERGRFAYYGESRIAKFYTLGRSLGYDRNAVKPNFRRRFNPCIRLENKEYQDFKLQTLKDAIKKAKSEVQTKKVLKTPRDVKTEYINEVISKNMEMKSEDLGKLLGLAPSSIRRRRAELKNYKIEQKIVTKKLKTDENNDE